ncbi:MAG TPA: hydroxymethylglutaryl-CoA reductase [Gemmatimonadaceae bacterium]|nr:hydroxymethylglutaryl-CoA reductase [Gemmatimonadaceae bacterium]
MFVPSMLLKQLYTFGSLRNAEDGVQFTLKNRLTDAELTGVSGIRIDGEEVPLHDLELRLEDDAFLPHQISAEAPLVFPLGQSVTLVARRRPLAPGKHELEIALESRPFGALRFEVQDSIVEEDAGRQKIPRDGADDYGEEAIGRRRRFMREFSGRDFPHVFAQSFDPHLCQGNCEHFVGVAQVPLGIAGPLRIEGEHARGEFLIPLATSEGTLVASYNRGMQVLNQSGGVKVCVVDDAMQRAPVFVFADAREGREFERWVQANFARIAEEAEATSSVAKLRDIDSFLASKFVYLRFNFTTGDAAGQNMVGRATFAACSWILDHYRGIAHFYLESNFATDKKASQINIMRTRGKRVTAEAVIKREVLIQRLRVEPESIAYHYGVANVGSILSGANNNGLHSANAITAMFIATGQDVANVSESSAGLVYVEVTPERDLYLSITIPSLIVATHGGGTALPTQRECLEMLGCVGRGTVHRLAEIVGGAVLAGELSLAAAISSSDWVSSHERYGRNR